MFGIYATRAYLTILTAFVVILTFYSSLTVHQLSFIVSNPSQATFERLYNSYSLTLTCPCSQVAIPQGQMVVLSPVLYHQVRIIVL